MDGANQTFTAYQPNLDNNKGSNKVKYIIVSIFIFLFVSVVGFITVIVLISETITKEEYTTAYEYSVELEELESSLNSKIFDLLIEDTYTKAKEINKSIISTQKDITQQKLKIKSSKAYSNEKVKEKFQKFDKQDIKFQELVTSTNKILTEVLLILNNCNLTKNTPASEIDSCNNSLDEVDASDNKHLKKFLDFTSTYLDDISLIKADVGKIPSNNVSAINDKNDELLETTEQYGVEAGDIMDVITEELDRLFPVEELTSLTSLLFSEKLNAV